MSSLTGYFHEIENCSSSLLSHPLVKHLLNVGKTWALGQAVCVLGAWDTKALTLPRSPVEFSHQLHAST